MEKTDDGNKSDHDEYSSFLTQKYFAFETGRGIFEIKRKDTEGRRYFSLFFDNQGRKTRREDYDANGNLKKLTIYLYEQGQLSEERFYRTTLKFRRLRNKETRDLEERDKDGNLIRIIEED
jgi:hypothetical protein